MRYIPQELLSKVNERWQVEANHSKPSFRITAIQAAVNTLMSEPIHEGIPSAYGDVAIRQLPGEKTPSKAYAVCIDEGTAKIYERDFPADIDHPWRYLWTLSQAKDVSIEFNGNWVLDATKQWYIIETEDVPYLFWVGSDDALYVQKWNDEQTRMTLDTGVTQVSVCKGWRSTLMLGLDQGLVVGYLKNGSVNCRSLCYQDTGELIWEPSYEVTELGEGNSTISVFRTNDFRIGIICENNGQMRWALSHRNYAGMSFRPETVKAQVKNLIFLVDKIRNVFVRSGHDRVNANTEGLWFLQYPVTAPVLEITNTEKIVVDSQTASGFRLFLNLPISSVPEDYASAITITPQMTVTGVSYNETLQAIEIAVSPNYSRSIDITIKIAESRGAFYYKHPGQKHPLETLTCSVAREITSVYGYANETVSAVVINPRVILDRAVFNYLVTQETVVAALQNVSVSLTPVSNLPI